MTGIARPFRRSASRLLGALALMLAAWPAAAQQVTLTRDSPLYAEPRLDAAQVAQLKQGASGEVASRRGGWLNLKTPEGSGWLFSFNVRYPPQKREPGSSESRTRAYGTNRPAIVSSIGIRGLDEEDLKQASFNAEQMKQLDGYAVGRAEAEESARSLGLAPETIGYLETAP